MRTWTTPEIKEIKIKSKTGTFPKPQEFEKKS